MQEFLIFLAALSIAVLLHEAGHAVFALASSRGRVRLQVGFGPAAGFDVGRLELRFAPILLGGFCAHDGGEGRADRAIIAAAGPVASILTAAALHSTRHDLWQLNRTLADVGDEVMIASLLIAVISAVPVSYAYCADSDGLTVLRALTPASRTVLKAPHAEPNPERPLRLPFALLLGTALVLGTLANFWLGAFTTALFASVYLAERRGGP